MDDRLFDLTARQAQVMVLVCRGFTAKEIARKLRLSLRTVENTCERTFPKIAPTRSQAIYRLGQFGFLETYRQYMNPTQASQVQE